MFDFSWSEMMLIGAIALVAIGPKDLPKALKTAGTVVRKARGLAREFHNSIDEMIKESELDEVRRSVHEATTIDINAPAEKRPVMIGPPVTTPPAIQPPVVQPPVVQPPEAPSPVAHDGVSEPGLPPPSQPQP